MSEYTPDVYTGPPSHSPHSRAAPHHLAPLDSDDHEGEMLIPSRPSSSSPTRMRLVFRFIKKNRCAGLTSTEYRQFENVHKSLVYHLIVLQIISNSYPDIDLVPSLKTLLTISIKTFPGIEVYNKIILDSLQRFKVAYINACVFAK